MTHPEASCSRTSLSEQRSASSLSLCCRLLGRRPRRPRRWCRTCSRSTFARGAKSLQTFAFFCCSICQSQKTDLRALGAGQRKIRESEDPTEMLRKKRVPRDFTTAFGALWRRARTGDWAGAEVEPEGGTAAASSSRRPALDKVAAFFVHHGSFLRKQAQEARVAEQGRQEHCEGGQGGRGHR